jgi:hypothetical protein
MLSVFRQVCGLEERKKGGKAISSTRMKLHESVLKGQDVHALHIPLRFNDRAVIQMMLIRSHIWVQGKRRFRKDEGSVGRSWAR